MRNLPVRALAVLAVAAASATATAYLLGTLDDVGAADRAAEHAPRPIPHAAPAASSPEALPDVRAAVPGPAAVVPLAYRPATPADPQLRAKIVRTHGTLVVDMHGMTVYRSDKDSATPSRSRCTGPCARLWKPVVTGGAAIRVFGIDPSLVSSIRRPDGSRQLTIAGWPVYRFVKDRRPGDVAGHCKGGFFAITPEGAKSM